MEYKKNEHDPESDIEKKADAAVSANDGSAVGQRDSGQADELKALKEQLAEKASISQEYFERLQRLAAEFDNYKKRTAKEKEAIATDTMCEVFSSIIPVVDNLEKALGADNGEQNAKAVREGVELIHKQLKTVMLKYGLEEIKCLGEKFDPELHNAVMHVEDRDLGEGVVAEELQKGYALQDRVVRHSVVKVAN